MFQQVIPRSFLWLVSFCAVLIIGIIGCGGDDDDNEWVGTWSLETVDGKNVQAQFEAFALLAQAFGEEVDISYIDAWTFDGDGTWRREATLEVKLAADQAMTSTKIMGAYSLSGSDYTLTVNDATLTAEGNAELLEETDIGSDFESGYTETGTWSRTGNTLTLTSDAGMVLGLKKK